MTVGEAIQIARSATPDSELFRIRLACGFTPLHLQTFLAAHLQRRLPGRRVEVAAGLYGDTAGTIESIGDQDELHGVAIALEWPDLDPRLGFRSAGKWTPATVAGIPALASASLQRLGEAILRLAPGIRVAISLPTLPLPPVFFQPGWQASDEELRLECSLLDFAAGLGSRVAIVNRQRLAQDSPEPARFDLKSELARGLPYSVAHADAMGSVIASLLLPPAPKKGIITDLDNTFWHGIVGDAGPENVTWDLANHQLIHGLYQKILEALAEQGVLVAIASKNDPAIAEKALARADLLMNRDRFFPVEIHWGAKSGSVAKILKTWNIGADSVVFVDDSAMELAEVAAAHPEMACLQFPENDANAAHALLGKLRDLFGKESISREDSLRIESIRQGAEFAAVSEGRTAPEAFLSAAEARIEFDFRAAPEDKRRLELVNKTNQFNLNGLRWTEADWRREIARPGKVVCSIAYEDRFGPLGTIAVLLGTREGSALDLECWVMSCRAFARRIEHQTLLQLFDRYGVDEIRVAYTPTPRNGPVGEFCAAILGESPESRFVLTRERFEAVCPPLYHQVNVLTAE
jgi:FkbH-like protein